MNNAYYASVMFVSRDLSEHNNDVAGVTYLDDGNVYIAPVASEKSVELVMLNGEDIVAIARVGLSLLDQSQVDELMAMLAPLSSSSQNAKEAGGELT